MWSRRGFLQACLCAILICSGLSCSGKSKSFTNEDFTKIKQGASESEVNEVLGPPDRTKIVSEKMKAAYWVRDGNEYGITYVHGKLESRARGKPRR